MSLAPADARPRSTAGPPDPSGASGRTPAERRRIVIVSDAPSYGGTERHLAELLTRLDYTRCFVVVLCVAHDFVSGYIPDHVRNHVEIRCQRLTKSFSAYWLALRALRPDTIVFLNGHFALFPGRVWAAACLAGARRLVAIEHVAAPPAPPATDLGLIRRYLGWRARHLARFNLPARLRDVTICVSDAVRKRLVEEYGYSAARMRTVRNGVDLRRFPKRCTPRTDSENVGLVCVARLSLQKRVDILLRAMTIVCRRHPGSRCIIVGEGPLASELQALRDELGLQHNVTFAGHQDDVRPFLDAADIFVLASDFEGLPLSVAEAMASELPCIVTDVGGNREIVVHEETGLVAPPGSPAALAGAIERLIADPAERRRLGVRGRARVEASFDVDEVMARIQSLILD